MRSTSARGWNALGLAIAASLLAVLGGAPAWATDDPTGPAQALTVTVSVDRTTYVNGDTLYANATVYRTPAPTAYVINWSVFDSASAVLNETPDGGATFAFPIPLNYSDSAIRVSVVATDTDGRTAAGEQTAGVTIGVMALRLDRAEFVPGDAITATYSVRSHVIVRPTYDYQVDDSAGTIVESGNTNGTSFTYQTPIPASATYAFLVTARDGTNRTSAQVSIAQVRGVDLRIALDRETYAAGDTVRAHLTLAPRGTTSLPSQFEWFLSMGAPSGQTTTATAITTVPEVDLAIAVPAGTPNGHILLFAFEERTSASRTVTVHVGTTSALWTTELGGIPLFAVLLGLLIILLLVAVVALWRRVSGGPVAVGRLPPTAEPTPIAPPPPPPPEPPGPASTATPMSVPCGHCGKPIELSTSKRPIEVMCPSCGEPQLVS